MPVSSRRTRTPRVLSPALTFLCVALLASASRSQGRLYPWGISDQSSQDFGQVSQAPQGADFTDMAAGAFHALAVRADGSLAAWGRDDYGEVSSTPTGTGFASVAAGSSHSLALRTDGSIVAWGSDLFDQVGHAPPGPGFIQIAADGVVSMALRPDGSIVTWGYNGFGQVLNTPPGPGFKQVEVGSVRCWALQSDGAITWWGWLNNNPIINHPTGTGFTRISMVEGYGLALRPNGSIVQWGSTFTGMPTNTGYIQIAAMETGGIALHGDGSVHAWGVDQYELVSGAPAGLGYSRLKAGNRFFALALRSDDPGSAFCFGDGNGTPCPCSATGAPRSGCPNTAGPGATLEGFGPAFTTLDAFQLELTGLPAQTPGLLLRGSGQTAGGLGSVVGDGLLCVGGQTARSHVQVSSPAGSLLFTDFAGQSFTTANSGLGVATHYQLWYRDVSNTCTGAGFNFSNGWTATWLP